VLAYYGALERGDGAAAQRLLGPGAVDLVSGDGRPFEVQEIREYPAQPTEERAPQRAWVRLAGANPAASENLSGTWLARWDGRGWRLEQPALRPTVPLAALARALPGGARLLATASGDLRGDGQAVTIAVIQPAGSRPWPTALVLFAPGPTALVASELTPADPSTAPQYPSELRIEDVNGDGRADLVVGGGLGAHSSSLLVEELDGSRMVSLFEGSTNTPGLDLVDLDGDGRAEILLPISGYCGSYAASPQLRLVLRWRDGAYRPASADFPRLQDERFFDYVARALQDADGDGRLYSEAASACLQHLAAVGHAIRNESAATSLAYGAYASRRSALSNLQGSWPSYVGDPRFSDEMRELIARADAGRLGSWQAPERAVLHLLLANSLEASAGNRRDDAAALLDAAAGEYRAALSLDPDSGEARAGLARLGR
jgi:hypothetical protein